MTALPEPRLPCRSTLVRPALLRPALLAGLLLAAGCAGEPASLPADPAPGTAAPATASPGKADADGLCLEHGVLQVVCPKCNPALAAVFKAKGDWCPEHGFPESFCPLCHPERGGRPAVDVRDDGAPAHGLKIRFKTRETARLAGIATVPAEVSPAEETLEAPARLAYDATRVALVSTPVDGIVTELHSDVGSRVSKGAALATLRSASIGAERARLDAVRSALAGAEATLERRRSLQAAGVASPRDVQEAEQAVASARAELSALEGQLGAVGSGGGGGGTWTARAPIAGEITRREAGIGAGVSAGGPLFEVVDATRLQAALDVPERDLSRVAIGAGVTLRFDAFPERTFPAEVAWIAPTIDAATRTVEVRALVDNPDRLLRANMYGSARIAIAGAPPAVRVPVAAVQRVGDVTLVFVRLSEDQYETRRVEVRAVSGEEARLSSGVQPGEDVVTTGSFLLKTETLKDSIGAGCCDVE